MFHKLQILYLCVLKCVYNLCKNTVQPVNETFMTPFLILSTGSKPRPLPFYLSQVYQGHRLWNQEAVQTTVCSGQGSGWLKLSEPASPWSVPNIQSVTQSDWRPSQETGGSLHVRCYSHPLSGEQRETTVERSSIHKSVMCVFVGV